jgi:glycolate oxidase FAD binding subunit
MGERLREQVIEAAARGQRLRIRGGGTKDWYGEPVSDAGAESLDAGAHRGIVDYEPTELVITARCGTPLAELEAALAQRGQMLGFEPPHYGATATIGGCVAAGLSGPRRASAGAVRDFLLGTRLLDGRGEELRFGGTVMKNVAGYDVSRLLAGSLGVLGVITEVSLKVLPRPPAEATIAFALDAGAALRRLNEWGGQPLPLSASAWAGGVLTLRLSGAAAAVRAALAALGGERLPDERAAAYWAGIREQTDPYFTAAGPLWRLSVPSVTPPLALEGDTLIEWGGALRWLRSTAPADQIRGAARAAGGHATLFRRAGTPAGVPTFDRLEPATLAIHRRLKAEFDPSGLFNPGRLHPEL